MRAALKIVRTEPSGISGSLATPLISRVAKPRSDRSSGTVAVVDLSKSYVVNHRPKRILDGINFTVEASQKLGVLGRNGAGEIIARSFARRNRAAHRRKSHSDNVHVLANCAQRRLQRQYDR